MTTDGLGSGSYRFAGMSDACVTLRMPDGTAVEGVGRTMNEADADARRRASDCCGALLADTGVKACWCPPMDAPSDPDQHEVGCLLATVIRIDQARAREAPSTFRVLPDVLRWSWSPPAIPAGCYAASWGWVHVRPGCRCLR